MVIQVLLITKWPADISGFKLFVFFQIEQFYLFHLKSQSGQGLSLSLYIKGGLSSVFLISQWLGVILLGQFCQQIVLLSQILQLFVCLFLKGCVASEGKWISHVLIEKSADFLFFPTAENSTKMCAVLCDKTLQFSVRTWLCWMNPFFLIHFFAPCWCSNPDYLTRSPIQPQTLLCWTLEGLAICPTGVHWSSGLW